MLFLHNPLPGSDGDEVVGVHLLGGLEVPVMKTFLKSKSNLLLCCFCCFKDFTMIYSMWL